MDHTARGAGFGRAVGLAALGLILSAMTAIAMGSIPGGGPADNCANADGALNDAAFVITTSPSAGERVESGFAVAGCSRTFESNVNWKLLARNGTELASGQYARRWRRWARAVLLHRHLHRRSAADRSP